MKRRTAAVALLGLTVTAHAAQMQAMPIQGTPVPGTPTAWAAAFPAPATLPALHLTASYPDAAGKAHTLEFWRGAQGQVVRRTDNRAELWMTPQPDDEDAYQLRDLASRVAYDVHRVNLYRLGIFTDRWDVQHLLDQPRTAYTLTLGAQQATALGPCRWVAVTPNPGAATQSAALEACWSSAYALPLIERRAGRELLSVQTIDSRAVTLPNATLPDASQPGGWQVYDADEDIAPD